jgi:hypothetical protein
MVSRCVWDAEKQVRSLPSRLPLCAGKINRNAGGIAEVRKVKGAWAPKGDTAPASFPLCVVRKYPGVASGCGLPHRPAFFDRPRENEAPGKISEWLKESDCKSDGSAFTSSNLVLPMAPTSVRP